MSNSVQIKLAVKLYMCLYCFYVPDNRVGNPLDNLHLSHYVGHHTQKGKGLHTQQIPYLTRRRTNYCYEVAHVAPKTTIEASVCALLPKHVSHVNGKIRVLLKRFEEPKCLSKLSSGHQNLLIQLL